MRIATTDRNGTTTVTYTGDLAAERTERLADLSAAADAVIDARYSAPVREGLLMRAAYLNGIVTGLTDGQPRSLSNAEQSLREMCLSAQDWIGSVRSAESAARAQIEGAQDFAALEASEPPQWPE